MSGKTIRSWKSVLASRRVFPDGRDLGFVRKTGEFMDCYKNQVWDWYGIGGHAQLGG